MSDAPLSLPTRMVTGAFSGCVAATACHPLDVIRVQMQIETTGGPKYKNIVDAGSQIYSRAGVGGVYAGLSAAYLRQWLYGSCRMGMFGFLTEKYKAKNDKRTPPLPYKLVMGSVSGGIGSAIGNPSELALVRMGADSKLPKAERRGYKNVFDCVSRIGREEGVRALWTGARPTITRAVVISGCLMGITSQTKEYLTANTSLSPNGVPIMFVSATVASFFANLASMPMDVTKSRIQNMPVPPAGQKAMYNGMFDCASKSIKTEGPLVLWSGFTPAFIKLAPYTVISLTVLQNLTLLIFNKNAL